MDPLPRPAAGHTPTPAVRFLVTEETHRHTDADLRRLGELTDARDRASIEDWGHADTGVRPPATA